MSIVPTFLRGGYSFGLRPKEGRTGTPNLAGMLPQLRAAGNPHAAADASDGAQPDPKTVLEMLNHAAEALDYLQIRCRELETAADEAANRANHALADATQSAEAWQRRALASEAQVHDLETRLGDADQTAMELRARLVCLYGKLAASVDTVRFQTLARVLADQEKDGGRGVVDAPHPRVAAA